MCCGLHQLLLNHGLQNEMGKLEISYLSEIAQHRLDMHSFQKFILKSLALNMNFLSASGNSLESLVQAKSTTLNPCFECYSQVHHINVVPLPERLKTWKF